MGQGGITRGLDGLACFQRDRPSIRVFLNPTSWWGVQARFEILRPKRSSLKFRVPEADDGCLAFLTSLLTIDSKQRPTALEALQHPWLSHQYE
jgi:serine/threonine protein kinase